MIQNMLQENPCLHLSISALEPLDLPKDSPSLQYTYSQTTYIEVPMAYTGVEPISDYVITSAEPTQYNGPILLAMYPYIPIRYLFVKFLYGFQTREDRRLHNIQAANDTRIQYVKFIKMFGDNNKVFIKQSIVSFRILKSTPRNFLETHASIFYFVNLQFIFEIEIHSQNLP